LEDWQAAAPDALLSSATLLADLRPLSFKLVRALQPAMRW